MKRVTINTFLFLAVLSFVACAPKLNGTEQAASDEAASGETRSLSEPATATMVATATEETGVTKVAASPMAAVDATATPAPVTTEASPTDPPPSPTVESAESTVDVVINGRTTEGAYFLGRADAPVTIIDYSDFM